MFKPVEALYEYILCRLKNMKNQFPFIQLIIVVVLFRLHTGYTPPQATSLTNVGCWAIIFTFCIWDVNCSQDFRIYLSAAYFYNYSFNQCDWVPIVYKAHQTWNCKRRPCFHSAKVNTRLFLSSCLLNMM